MFACSCRDIGTHSYSKNTNDKREKEVCYIMRAYYINHTSNDLTSKERKVLQKMKKDFYYEPRESDNPAFVIPGPSWTFKGPLNLTKYFELLQKLREKEPSYRGPVFDFVDKYKKGDEIFYYKSNQLSWNNLMGIEGYVIIRDNKICYDWITAVN